MSLIKIPPTREVCFSGIRLQTKGSVESGLGQRKPLRGVINPKEIELVVRIGELAISEEKLRITCNSLVQQVNRLQ